MKKILFSILTIGVVAGAVVGVSGAFFSDTETSVGNTFTAGAIDLLVDNESYYNGAISSSTSWTLQDLKEGLLFFNFLDLKPDDEGEDTISLHVQNDAWACMELTLTSNDDKSSTEPELDAPDVLEDINNTWDGELAQNLRIFWWADDGDNVFETGENPLPLNGTSSVQTFAGIFGVTASSTASTTVSVALADASHNVWGTPGPLPGGQTSYIAKAWCFGDLVPGAVVQDGLGHQAGATNGPLVRGTGVSCDGSLLGNVTQTDGITLDVAFRATQQRHNPNFQCGGQETRTAKITVIKQITNNDGGNNVVSDFQLFVDNGVVHTGVTSGVTTNVSAGNYTVGETGVSGYEASFSGDCDPSGNITLASGDNKTCTITNDDLRGNITLIKNVINDNGGTTASSTFQMKIDGLAVPNGTSRSVTSNSPHFITENPIAGYHFISITGAGCPASTSTPVVLNEGQAITCTINNSDNGGAQ